MKTFYNQILKNKYLILILSIAAFLRIYHLDFQGAWLDEIHTLKESDPELTLKEMYDVVNWREGIPHFYFIVVRIFGIIFGHTLFSIRLVSVVFGVLGVLCIYLLGKSISNKQVAYISAFFLAIHPFHIEYSQEGRSYAMLMTFVIFSFYRLSVFLKEINLKNAVFLGVACGLITNAQPIGIISVISIFFIIILFFLLFVEKKERGKYMKNSFISGVITLIVFYPVYQIVEKVSKLTSFWVQKPTYDYVIFVLTQISGGESLFYYMFVTAILVLTILTIVSVVKNKNVKANPFFKQYVFIIIWIFFYFIFILVKSLGPSSLMLQRYLSPMLPGLIILLALTIDRINKNKIKAFTTILIMSLFVFVLIYKNDYYNKRVKTQFNDICLQIKKENKNNETIVSSWGWLLTYFFDRKNELKNVNEKSLDTYINDVKTNSVNIENFWYVDGNSKPYKVETQTQEFLENNYFLEKTIELHDCWAKHYITKKPIDTNLKFLKLKQFKNAKIDGEGNLMFWENSKSTSMPIQLDKGNYLIEISCLSLPKVKINGENAKFSVFINNKKHGNYEAPENETGVVKINYQQARRANLILDIEFVNDFSNQKIDRNLQISKIEIINKVIYL